MSWRVERVRTVQLTNTDTRGGRENSPVLLFLENGPDSFGALKPTQGDVTRCVWRFTDLVSTPTSVLAVDEIGTKPDNKIPEMNGDNSIPLLLGYGRK